MSEPNKSPQERAGQAALGLFQAQREAAGKATQPIPSSGVIGVGVETPSGSVEFFECQLGITGLDKLKGLVSDAPAQPSVLSCEEKPTMWRHQVKSQGPS